MPIVYDKLYHVEIVLKGFCWMLKQNIFSRPKNAGRGDRIA